MPGHSEPYLQETQCRVARDLVAVEVARPGGGSDRSHKRYQRCIPANAEFVSHPELDGERTRCERVSIVVDPVGDDSETALQKERSMVGVPEPYGAERAHGPIDAGVVLHPAVRLSTQQEVGLHGRSQAEVGRIRTVTVTDTDGNTVTWGSAGSVGFKGSRKSTPFAARLAAEQALKAAMSMGIQEVEVYIKGPGPGRDASLRALRSVGLKMSLIADVTPIPHNGPRARKQRRV